jgi:putative ABC transport system permease protein
MSYGVRERARELGIRLALGASGRHLAWMVLARGCRMTCCGLVIGVGASLALRRMAASLLYGVTTHDPITLAAVCGALLVVAALASLLPARWAARVDPMLTLRNE